MKESEQENKSLPEWEVEWYTIHGYSSVAIRHNGPKERPRVHYTIPPYGGRDIPNWTGWYSVNWLMERKSHWGNINCTCGHWNKIPRRILEQFIATVNIMRRP